MRQTVGIIFVFMLLATQACGPRPDKTDSSPTDEPGKSPSDQRMERWLDYYGFKQREFTDSATYAQPYRLGKQSFQINPEDPFADLFVYNPDSTMAIDLDSYHLILEKDQEGRLFSPGRGADMEIGLIDLTENTRERLLFCGPACLFEEGSFQPAGNITITGFSKNGQGYLPTIWQIDPGTDSLKVKHLPEAYNPEEINYLSDVRLSHIRFPHDDGPAVPVDL